MSFVKRPLLLLIFLLSVTVAFGNETNAQDSFSDSLDYHYSRSDFGQALNYLLRNKPSAESTDDSTEIEWLINYSLANQYAAKTDISFESIQKALELSDKRFNYLHFKAEVQLIEFYRNTGSHDKALKLISTIEKKGIKYEGRVKCRFYHRAAAVYNEWQFQDGGPAYLDTAIQYSNKALLISRKLNLKHDQAISYNELGAIYEIKKEFSKSIAYFDSAQVIWKEISLVNYVNVFKNKSNYYLHIGEYDSAKAIIKKGLTLIENKDFYRLKSELYQVLKLTHYEEKDSLLAFKAELKENKFNVLYLERKMRDRLENLTIQYDLREKDIEIERNKEVIKQEKKQLQITVFIIIILISLIAFIVYLVFVSRRKNSELQTLLKENDFLLGEANHRIKNNLQLIISLLGREVYKKNIQTKENSVLTGIVEKINAIATLHQQLYLNKSKREVSIKDYMDNIGHNFQGIFQDQNIVLSRNIEDFSMNIDQAVYLGLLLTELFTNSIKHAFEGQSNNKISITINREHKNRVFLDYQDNGIGLENNQEPSLVNLLVKQLKAESHNSSHLGYKLKIYFKI